MAQILQIKRTNTEIKTANVSKPLDEFNNETIAQGELFYANAGVEGVGAADEGVLYIGSADTAGVNADAIGGKAFTKMLSPKEADDKTVITQSVGGTSAASITLADAQSTESQKTISLAAPDSVAADATIKLPSAAGANSTTASTVITTDGSGEVGALTSSAAITGVSLTNVAGTGVIAADGKVTASSVDAGSGAVDGGTITGTTLATGGASINNAGAIVGSSVDVSGAATAASFTADANGNISTSGSGTISTAGGGISNTGAITGISVDVGGFVEATSLRVTADGSNMLATIGTDGTATVASLNAGSGTIQTTGTLSGGAADVDSLSVSNGGITNAGAISGATSITASGKISGAELEISGDMIVANTTDITIEDNLLQVASTATGSNTTNQSGWYAKVNDGSDGLRYAGMVYDNADAKFKVLQEDDGNAPTTSFNDATQTTGTLVSNVEGDTAGTHTGAVVGDVTGNVSGNAGGNAATATALAADMTLTLGGDLTGAVTTRGTSQTLTATIADASVQDSMLATDVKLSSMHDIEGYANSDAGKVLTVKSDGTLEWTSKTATGGEGSGSLYGIIASDDDDAGEVNIELTDNDASDNDKITLKEGNNVTLVLTDTAGDEKITISSTDTQLSDAEVNAAITKARIDELNVDAGTVNGKTVAGNVAVAVPANADFDNTQATYTISAAENAGDPDVDIKLVGGGDADGVTDTLSLTGTGGTSVTVSGDVITIDSEEDTNTTYALESSSEGSGAKVTLNPSSGDNQDVNILGSGATTVAHNGSTITVSSTNTTYVPGNSGLVPAAGSSGEFLAHNGAYATPDHDQLTNFVANEHINWVNANAGTIDPSNYQDNNTTYSAGDGLKLTGTDFDIDLTSNGGLALSGSGEDKTLGVDLAASNLSGQLADGDIASASDWNSAHDHISTTNNPHSVTATQVGLGSVENTALSTWNGTANITTVGTVSSGTWQGTAIADAQISSSASWNSAKTSVDSAESSFAAASAGDLVEWGDSGAITTTGTVSAGTVNVTTLQNNGGNINVIPNGGAGTFTLTFDNQESLTFDGDGITATGTMSLEGFTTDGGVL